MGDIVDFLFVFWTVLCGLVITLGTSFEQQIKTFLFEGQANDEKSKNNSLSSLDSWTKREDVTYSPVKKQQHHPIDSFDQYSSQQYGVSSTASQQQANYSLSNQHQPRTIRQAVHETQSAPYDSTYPLDPYGRSNDYNIQQTSIDGILNYEEPSYNQQQSTSTTTNFGSIPTASGFNGECVEWVNSILLLFYSQPDKYGPIISESVYRSLNEKLSSIVSSAAPDGRSELMLEFMGIDRELSSRPELTNIRTESESEKSVSATCKIYNHSLVFELATRRLGTNKNMNTTSSADDVALYELSLEQLEGKLKCVAVLSDKLIVVQFMDKPNTKILLRRKHQRSSVYPVPSPPISEDSLVSMILQALSQVVVDLYFGEDPDFPQYRNSNSNSGYKQRLNQLKDSASEIKRHIKQDFFGTLASNSHLGGSSNEKERKLFIKILRANNINYNQNVTCFLELDNPHQQALSSTKQASSNPYWDEHFLFTISDKSSELSLELWDSICQTPELLNSSTGQQQQQQQSSKRRFFGGQQQSTGTKKYSRAELTAGAKFLGLARVNIEELRKNPVQKVNLPLESAAGVGQQSADLSSSVGGELQVELLFLEHSVGSTLQKSSSMGSLCCQQGDVVSVDRKLTPTGYVITTTTITKPANAYKSGNLKHQSSITAGNQQQQVGLSRYDQLLLARNQSPISQTTTDHSELDINLDAVSSQLSAAELRNSTNELTSGAQHHQTDAITADRMSSGGRSRSRSRSRSFLRAIKKRFSFSRTRSRSVGESGAREESRSALGNNLDATSIDSRSRASSVISGIDGRAKSVPASRDPSEVPTIVINRGRLSDTASAFTFTHPKSQLVIECAEPRMGPDGSVQKNAHHYKYYAISDEAANKAKWRKRGVKLHLFNEHQFVACHLAGSSTCHLCGKVFSRRPGKQGYKCRNCHLLSHKQCHVKVDHNCPYATADGLKLEFIDQDPPAALIDSAQSQNRQQRTNRPTSMTAKSISMDVDDR